MYRVHVPCPLNSSHVFCLILLKLNKGFKDGLKICMWTFSESWNNFYHFFCIFNLDIFFVLILQKHIGSSVPCTVTPTTVLSRSFKTLQVVWRYACGFFRILKLFFITGFLLQYLGNWYRTNGPLVNFTIFKLQIKIKRGDINSPWN